MRIQAWHAGILLVFCILTLCSLLVFTRSAHADNTGLVGYWPMDEGSGLKLGDFSGFGNNGTLTDDGNGFPVWTNGKLNSALRFVDSLGNGGGQVNIGGSTQYAVTTKPFSVSAWVNISTFNTTSYPAVISLETNTTNAVFILIGNDAGGAGFFRGITFCGAEASWANSHTDVDPTPLIGSWHHIVVTYNGSGASTMSNYAMYLDGVAQSLSLSGGCVAETNTTVIGNGPNGTNPFEGRLDDIRIYNVALTAAQVATLYNLRASLHKPPNNLGLIGYWPMNEGSGTKAGDFSGFGHVGTLLGSPVPTWTYGRRGSALQFDGSQNHVNMGNIASMNGLSALTVSFWLKASAFHVNNNPGIGVLEKSACSGKTQDGPFEFAFDENHLGEPDFSLYSASGQFAALAGTSDTDDAKWHFVTATYDGTTAAIWVDGAFQGNSTNVSGTLTSTSTLFGIGGACSPGNPVSSPTQIYNGTIDDVRVYNRALGASDIANLYNQGTAGATQIQTSSASLDNAMSLGPKGGLVGHWTFDGPDISWATGIAADRSGQGNNGNLEAMSTTTSPVAGKLGQALKFNGIQANVVEADGVASAIKTGDVSFTAWIKFPSRYLAASPAELLLRNGDPASSNDIILQMNGNGCGCGSVSFMTIDNNSAVNAQRSNTTSWAANTWYFVAGTYASSTGALHVYVNGLRDDSSVVNMATFRGASYSTHFFIGGENIIGDLNEPFNGTIDDPRVYNRSLSASDIAQLYKLGQATINR